MDKHEIQQMRDQFAARQWPRFLESVGVKGLRGWSGQIVEFRFPVVAVVGENGTGKTTLLRSAAAAYESESESKTLFPSDFFIETQWDAVTDVSLQYVTRQGGGEPERFQINKPTERWSYPEKRPKRNVIFLDIARILPLDAAIGYAKIAKQRAAEIGTKELSEESRTRLSHILGREYSRARFVTTGQSKKEVGLLTRPFGEISQFHQGAGEDATLDLVGLLESVPAYSLVVIDEIEASLHPRAQRRLIRLLMQLSRLKRLQFIVSTHSPFVLEELPPEGRVMLLPGPTGVSILYGASPEFALSRLDDESHPELHVFVEDREAAIMLREILAAAPAGSALLSRISIAPVGPANVVQVLGQLASADRLPWSSLAVLDGDTAADARCARLPGTVAPEVLVFSELKAQNWPNLPERFGVGAGDLMTWLEDAMLEPDHHRWTTIIGDRVRKSSTSVWEILAKEWAATCLTEADRQAVVQSIAQKLT